MCCCRMVLKWCQWSTRLKLGRKGGAFVSCAERVKESANSFLVSQQDLAESSWFYFFHCLEHKCTKMYEARTCSQRKKHWVIWICSWGKVNSPSRSSSYFFSTCGWGSASTIPAKRETEQHRAVGKVLKHSFQFLAVVALTDNWLTLLLVCFLLNCNCSYLFSVATTPPTLASTSFAAPMAAAATTAAAISFFLLLPVPLLPTVQILPVVPHKMVAE